MWSLCASIQPLVGAECMCCKNVVISKFRSFLWNARAGLEYLWVMRVTKWLNHEVYVDINFLIEQVDSRALYFWEENRPPGGSWKVKYHIGQGQRRGKPHTWNKAFLLFLWPSQIFVDCVELLLEEWLSMLLRLRSYTCENNINIKKSQLCTYYHKCINRFLSMRLNSVFFLTL